MERGGKKRRRRTIETTVGEKNCVNIGTDCNLNFCFDYGNLALLLSVVLLSSEVDECVFRGSAGINEALTLNSGGSGSVGPKGGTESSQYMQSL